MTKGSWCDFGSVFVIIIVDTSVISPDAIFRNHQTHSLRFYNILSMCLFPSPPSAERAVGDGERMLDVLQRWGQHRAEVRFFLRHNRAPGRETGKRTHLSRDTTTHVTDNHAKWLLLLDLSSEVWTEAVCQREKNWRQYNTTAETRAAWALSEGNKYPQLYEMKDVFWTLPSRTGQYIDFGWRYWYIFIYHF